MGRVAVGLFAAMIGWILLGASPAAAEPLAREDVPAPLEPWIDWVLRGHEEAACPFLQAPGRRGEGERACVWPGRLALELDARGGRFRQTVFAARSADVALPGGGAAWPEDVRVDGERVPVGEAEGEPRIRVAPGEHAIEGRFVWGALPPGLRIPPLTGLVALAVDGEPVARPRRDASGALWLREARADAAAVPAENRVDLEVARRFQDAVPPRLHSRITLRVSGEAREELLGVVLPEGWLATAIDAPLPTRLDPDGRLRVQLRPGDWTIEIAARMAKATTRLAPPVQPVGARWDESEVWSIALAPELRLVELSGAPSIDPVQAEIPADWQALPTYRLDADATVMLEEKRRGSEGSAGDQLTLERTWYLDFDGGGATVLDRLQGTLRRSLRLEMGADTELGRVAIDGIDQPITRRADGERSGIETPLGRLALDAPSRIPSRPRRLSAIGWESTSTSRRRSGSGYRLLHASGVDAASETWLSRWNLLSVFFVLLMTVVSVQLFGPLGAGVACATLVLVWNEPGAPMRIWLALAVVEALRRAVARGRFARAVQVVQGIIAVLLVAIAVPFAIAQLRGGLFPALARPDGGGSIASEVRELAVSRVSDALEGGEFFISESMGSRTEYAAPAMPDEALGRERAAALEADPSSIVPTGPGRPDWRWEAVALRWSGPVTRDHVLGLWLLPPFANGLLAILRVLLVVALAGLFVLGWRRQAFAGAGLGPLGIRLALSLAIGVGAATLAVSPSRAEMPTPELLEALRSRLLEPPDCAPSCASLSRLEVEVRPDRLKLSATVAARAETGVPLPGAGAGESSWLPEEILLDGRRAEAIRRDAEGIVWLRVGRGVHSVVLEGALPASETVSLPLPLAPRRTRLATAPRGWSVGGIGQDGSAAGALQLVRDAAPIEPGSAR